jgi:hypothetical protein
VQPHRILIREGELGVVTKKAILPHHVFLFDDMLILAKHSEALLKLKVPSSKKPAHSSDETFQYVDSVYMSSTSVTDLGPDFTGMWVHMSCHVTHDVQ